MSVNPHVKRVTLNLLRHAACCPDDLRGTLDKLSTPGCAWDLDTLTGPEKELIYATVDEDLANQALGEFEADTDTIVDHRGCDEHCKLCGHPHIRFEFTLRNQAGGTDVLTGSRCIETYGINVDGEGTAELALKALRKAIAKAKRAADRDDWQVAHPNHATEMAEYRDHRTQVLACTPSAEGLWRFLRASYKRRALRVTQESAAILKYYRREGFLTDKRTADFYGKDGKGGALRRMAALVTEINAARMKRSEIVARWDRFISACPDMTPAEKVEIGSWRRSAQVPEDLWASAKAKLNAIHRRNGSPKIAKPEKEAA